jgi:hypothetical protein
MRNQNRSGLKVGSDFRNIIIPKFVTPSRLQISDDHDSMPFLIFKFFLRLNNQHALITFIHPSSDADFSPAFSFFIG